MRLSHSVRWEHKLGASVISVACTPTMSAVIAGCVDQKAYAYSGDGSRRWEERFENEVWATACTTDGNFFAVGTANKKPCQGTIHILNYVGHTIASFAVGGPVWALAFDPTGLKLAACTWLGYCHLIEFSEGQWRERTKVSLPGAGAYGVRFVDDCGTIAAIGYGNSLHIIDQTGKLVTSISCDLVGYNLSVSRERDMLYAGCRNGSILQVVRTGDTTFVSKIIRLRGVSRAISGVAASGDGSVVVTGCFDGRLRTISEDGELFWESDLVGEVWSVATSPNASQIAVGTGDSRVILIDNKIIPDNVSELRSHIRTLSSNILIGNKADRYDRTLAFMSELGLFSYALRFLRERQEQGHISQELFTQFVATLHKKCPFHHPARCELNFELGQIKRSLGEHWEAAAFFVRAAQSPEWRLRGFSEAANAFYHAGHQAAALSCFRRAREPLLTNDDLRIIYTLARSFEDLGHLEIARDHLDIIMVQNPDYRDVASRLQSYQSYSKDLTDDRQRVDYTGVTVNLLGPDVPSMDIDPRLRNVIEARTVELGITESGKDEYKAIIEQLYQQGILQATESAESVEYNRNSYIKYDFLLPEDDVKKRLEAVNVIAISRKVKRISRSLDIGTATGRYPGIFVNFGWDAYGVDYEEEAIEYAKSKIAAEPAPKFSVGDARSLVFKPDFFDFVTCMMGTFFHIPLGDQSKAVEEMARVCRPGGIVAISTWDIDCPHLTYLSMYSVNEKELITRNARPLSAMLDLLGAAGLKNVSAVPFSLVPDTISYDLGIEKLSIDGVQRLLEIDIATRRAMPSKHGQMFIAYGEK